MSWEAVICLFNFFEFIELHFVFILYTVGFSYCVNIWTHYQMTYHFVHSWNHKCLCCTIAFHVSLPMATYQWPINWSVLTVKNSSTLAKNASSGLLTLLSQWVTEIGWLKMRLWIVHDMQNACLLSQVQLDVSVWFVQDQLKGDSITELRLKFIRRLEDAVPAGEDWQYMFGLGLKRIDWRQ